MPQVGLECLNLNGHACAENLSLRFRLIVAGGGRFVECTGTMRYLDRSCLYKEGIWVLRMKSRLRGVGRLLLHLISAFDFPSSSRLDRCELQRQRPCDVGA